MWPLQASAVDGNIYVIGRSGVTYAYNPLNDSWTTKAKAPSVNNEPIAGFVTTVFGNGIYVIGISDLNLVYYPLNDSWSQLSSSQPYPFEGLMGYGSFDAAACASTGMLAPEKIYVFFDNQTYVYDPANDNWESGAAMPEEQVNFGGAAVEPEEHVGFGVAVVNDTFYIIGGDNILPVGFQETLAPSNANEQYIPIGYGTS